MKYILIDNFNGNINIVNKDDGSGEPLILDSLQDAKFHLEDCQNGIIVPFGNTIDLLERCQNYMDIRDVWNDIQQFLK